MNDGFQYGDIIFLGIVAVFVLLRLRSMLGKSGGADPDEVWKSATRSIYHAKGLSVPDKPGKKPADEETIPLNLQDNKAVADGLKAIRTADPSFSVTDFLSGSKVALEWVIEAFSKGDKAKLQMVLSAECFKRFSEDIDLHANDADRRETTLVSILATDITQAGMKDNKTAHITVQFTTEQINVLRDKEGNVVGGDPSQIEKAIDIWTFERDTASRDPNWKIVAT